MQVHLSVKLIILPNNNIAYFVIRDMNVPSVKINRVKKIKSCLQL